MREHFTHRIIEAIIWLASGKPADAAAAALIRAFDVLDFDQGRTQTVHRRGQVSREAISFVSDGAVSLLANQASSIVVSKLLDACKCLSDTPLRESRKPRRGPRTANAPAAEASLWNRRLAAWTTRGGADPFTRLLDRVTDFVLRGRTVITPEEAAARLSGEPTSRSEEPSTVRGLQIIDGDQLFVIDADDFLSIEEDVRWVRGPTGKLGIVGGRPFIAVGTDNGESSQAVRRVLDGQEVLTHFQRLEILESPA